MISPDFVDAWRFQPVASMNMADFVDAQENHGGSNRITRIFRWCDEELCSIAAMKREYNRREMDCERLFAEGGPFIHLHTKPLEDELLLRNDAEMDVALSFMTIAAAGARCVLLAFALMNNHFHFVLEGGEDDCRAFYEDFQHRLAKYMAHESRSRLAYMAQPGFTLINNLKHLRDEIVYVVRNPFVDRVNVNPFSYRWCSGYLYYNDMLEMMQTGDRVCDLKVTDRRAFNHSRNADVDERIRVWNGIVLPASVVAYQRVMSFFENARQYTNWVLRSVESQVETARRLGERLVLDDTELWQVVTRLCKNRYHVGKPIELSQDARVELINRIKYDYNASNAQIARCLGFPRAMIDQMFPLAARR